VTIEFPAPDLQIDFAAALADIRVLYLQDALLETVAKLKIPSIDIELAQLAPSHSLATLAGHGLRGEMMFPVPLVLTANPRLLAYYRLLYGFSQKEFYGPTLSLGRFKVMELEGKLGRSQNELSALCKAFCEAGALLLAGINPTSISTQFLDDLTLLTLGPQLRGGANVKRGVAGIRVVFNAIQEIVKKRIVAQSDTVLELKNAAGRRVLIQFASDPDIIIREEMSASSFRLVIAIEVKAGADFSNIHNRLGEAEKSHQKAKASGYTECWTVVNVDKTDMAIAKKESPTTNRFYRISDLVSASGTEYDDFRARIISLTGIKV